MADQKVFTARFGAVFIQRSASVDPEYLGCHDLGDIEVDDGGIELIRGRDVMGRYQVMTYTEAAPELIEIELTAWVDKVAHYLERVACPFYLHVNQRCGGPANVIGNYERGFSLEILKRTTRGLTNLAMGIGDDADTQQTFGLAGAPPLLDIYRTVPDRQTTTEANAAKDIVFVKENLCGDCTPRYEEGMIGVFAAAALGGATAKAWYTLDGGSTWTICAGVPTSTVSLDLTTVTYFWLDAKRIRFIVGIGSTQAAVPAQVAYTDFNLETDTAIGATWTVANVSAANAYFFFGPKSIYAHDKNNIWAVVGPGFIYKSADGGATWTAQESGILTTEDYYVISGAPNSKLFLVTAGENNALARSRDGGVTWSALTGPSAQATDEIISLDIVSESMFVVGYNDGALYVTYNGGLSWAALTNFSTTPAVAQVRAVKFLNPVQGWMLTNSGGPVGTMHVTRDCGRSWEALTTPTNAGLNALDVVRSNLVYAAGQPQTSTAMILKTA